MALIFNVWMIILITNEAKKLWPCKCIEFSLIIFHSVFSNLVVDAGFVIRFAPDKLAFSKLEGCHGNPFKIDKKGVGRGYLRSGETHKDIRSREG